MDSYITLLDNVMLGLSVAFQTQNLVYCFIGVFFGTLIGVVPGIGALAAISMLFPITFHLDPTAALVMMAGIFYGTSYGGSIASILLHVPGTPSSAVACLDGHPMARQGRAGVALMMTTLSSFVGGSIGIILLMVLSPLIVAFAMSFGAAEYFSMMVLGLVAASSISSESAIKGIAMVLLGIAFGFVGLDLYTATPRFTFDTLDLQEGISLVIVAMGLFGIAEVIFSIRSVEGAHIDAKSITFRSMLPTRDDWRRFTLPTLRGTAIGSFFGALPGVGATIASFMSYAVEKRVAQDPRRFGKGAIEGVIAPEAANNAADQTAFIPTLTLGIPGSATMALMLGILMIHGIAPGPELMTGRPDMFWGLVMSFWVGNILLVILNIPLIHIWIRLLTVPYNLLYPGILVFVCIGVYSLTYSLSSIYLVVLFGAVGYVMRLLHFPAAPLILGFVLGPMMEEYFRRAMLLSRGDPMVFFERPVSGTIMVITVLVLIQGIYSTYRYHKRFADPSGAPQPEGITS